jgi:hypothetical protein
MTPIDPDGPIMFETAHWFHVPDGDLVLRDLLNRHYSRNAYKDGRKPKLSCGPGYKLPYRTTDGLAAFIWRKFIDKSGQQGVNCAMFRNEGPLLSSMLILEAEQLAWTVWPGERLYTYVNTRKVRSSNPGYCFLMAGWKKCGYTKSKKLLILEKFPEGER